MAKHVISFEFFFLAFSAMMPHGVSLKNPKNDKNIGKFCQNLIIHHFQSKRTHTYIFSTIISFLPK